MELVKRNPFPSGTKFTTLWRGGALCIGQIDYVIREHVLHFQWATARVRELGTEKKSEYANVLDLAQIAMFLDSMSGRSATTHKNSPESQLKAYLEDLADAQVRSSVSMASAA